MIYDIVIKRMMLKQIFVEADSKEEALDKVDQISPADIPLANWNNDCIDPIEDDVKEFRDLKEAREFYDNGDDIPAYRVLAGSLFEIKEEA